jgi:hypothetical protein
MFLDYSKIEKINFRGENIDHDFNVKILKSFEKIYTKAQEKNLHMTVTGGLGSCLLYKKIYRTIKDIDLLIIPREITKWFEIFIDGYDFCFEEEYARNPSQRLEDFFNEKINSLVFMDTGFQCKIEIINIKKSKVVEIVQINENGNLIKIKTPLFSYQNKLRFGRDKDLTDWAFFEKYLNI